VSEIERFARLSFGFAELALLAKVRGKPEANEAITRVERDGSIEGSLSLGPIGKTEGLSPAEGAISASKMGIEANGFLSEAAGLGGGYAVVKKAGVVGGSVGIGQFRAWFGPKRGEADGSTEITDSLFEALLRFVLHGNQGAIDSLAG